MVKIVQISAVVENYESGNEDHGTHRVTPQNTATIYGLGSDSKMYVWARTKHKKVKLKEPDEDGEEYHYETKYGWKRVTW